MPDTANPFLAEVIRDPESDDARSIYADWLEERGDPRGAFIRAQCELEHLTDADSDYFDTMQLQSELLDEHGEKWVAELGQELKKSRFRRGFIDEVTVLASRVVKNEGSLFQQAPIQWLRFNRLKGKGAALAALPALQHVRGLDLSGLVIPKEDLEALLRSTNLKNLTRLKARHHDVKRVEEITPPVADSQIADQLTELELTVTNETHQLAACSSLRSLCLENTFFGAPTPWSLLAPANLEQLSLKSVNLDFLAEAAIPWSQLKELKFSDPFSPSPKLIKTLADWGAFESATRIQLSLPASVERDATHIFTGGRLAKCETFNLAFADDYYLSAGKWQISDAVADAIAGADLGSMQDLALTGLPKGRLARILNSGLPPLRSLILHHSSLDKDDMQAIVNGPHRESLQRLGIGFDFTPTVMKLLREAEFPQLISLYCGTGHALDRVSKADLVKLLDSGAFPQLRKLSLDWMGLQGGTLVAVSKCDLPELRVLSFQFNLCNQSQLKSFLDGNRWDKLFQVRMHSSMRTANAAKFHAKFGSHILLDHCADASGGVVDSPISDRI